MKRLIVLLFMCSTVFAQELPDPQKTPGDVEPRLTKELLCSKGFTTKDWRNVSAAVKKEAYSSYGKTPKKDICCEVDHLISLEIGGSNNIKNLWPQKWSEAKLKDKLENALHKMVCADQISLEDAQMAIATDWWDAYEKYVMHLH